MGLSPAVIGTKSKDFCSSFVLLLLEAGGLVIEAVVLRPRASSSRPTDRPRRSLAAGAEAAFEALQLGDALLGLDLVVLALHVAEEHRVRRTHQERLEATPACPAFAFAAARSSLLGGSSPCPSGSSPSPRSPSPSPHSTPYLSDRSNQIHSFIRVFVGCSRLNPDSIDDA